MAAIFADDIFELKCSYMEVVVFVIPILVKGVPKGPSNNISQHWFR